MNEPTCKRCGQCCFLLDEKTAIQTNTPCKYLIFHPGGKTSCRIYPNRLGADIGNGNKCVLRKDSRYNFPDCPFNVLAPNKPMMVRLK